MTGIDARFRIRREKCETCLYAVAYPKETRDALLERVVVHDSYIQCHEHDLAAGVCCRGYYDAVGERGGTALQLAIRFQRMGHDMINWVEPGDYARSEEAEE